MRGYVESRRNDTPESRDNDVHGTRGLDGAGSATARGVRAVAENATGRELGTEHTAPATEAGNPLTQDACVKCGRAYRAQCQHVRNGEKPFAEVQLRTLPGSDVVVRMLLCPLCTGITAGTLESKCHG